ncbi:MAG: ThiF family adenylyltransferase [Burkholderiaceae bacterium]|nr:ThiF family adenylyltransferase [Burkholderiaceae bacterium]
MNERLPEPMQERYSRHLRLAELGSEGQRKLLAARVLVVGCGALGAMLASLLARSGVGALRIVDRDFVESSNLQRQALFDEDDVAQRLPKAEAARRKLARVNSDVSIEALVTDADARNIETLMRDVDLVLDGTDNAETRYVVNDACVKHRVPWVYGGVVGTRGLLMSVLPGSGPCLRCLYPQPPAPGELPTCDTLGVLSTAPATIAALQATEALKILAGAAPARGIISIDFWQSEFQRIEFAADPHCPTCVRREYPFLDARRTSTAFRLCGRDAIQISPMRAGSVDLDRLARALTGVGPVLNNGFLLEFAIEGCQLFVFRDGRVLVKGTSAPAVANGIVSRYLGG